MVARTSMKNRKLVDMDLVPREVRDLLEELELEILETRKRTHLCLKLRNKHGVRATIPMSLSPKNKDNAMRGRERQFRLFAEATTF